MTIIQLKYVVAVSESRSMQEAARREYVSQPNLSCAIKSLEDELGIQIFERSHSGVNLTNAGREFISYARQVLEQYRLIEHKYISKENKKIEFNVSSQHYAFAVNAFIDITNKYDGEKYNFSIIETQTRKVIDDVRSLRSDMGIIGFNNYNGKILMKMFGESNLEFHEVMRRETYVYLRKKHPLAGEKQLTLEQLEDYLSIPLKEKEEMIIGYITRKDMQLSDIAKDYIAELEKYKDEK